MNMNALHPLGQEKNTVRVPKRKRLAALGDASTSLSMTKKGRGATVGHPELVEGWLSERSESKPGIKRVVALVLVSLLAACGGGGTSAIPAHGGSNGGGNNGGGTSSKTARVAMSFIIPGNKNGTSARHRDYTSTGTQGISIDWVTDPTGFADISPDINPAYGGTVLGMAAPSLSYTGGGSLPATTYYVKYTYVTSSGETTPSAEASIAVPPSDVLVVAAPASVAGATGWNAYVSTSSGTETLQSANNPFSFGPFPSFWTEPTSGLVAGAAPPTVNTAFSGCSAAENSDGSFTCTFYVPGVPVGYEDFKISEWSGEPSGCDANGTGCTMNGSPTATNLAPDEAIVQNQQNAISFTLLPVVDSIAVLATPTSFVDGTSGAGTVDVVAKDAAGNIIIGGQQLVDENGQNLTIDLASASTHVTLGTTSFSTASGLSSTMTYDGSDVTLGGAQPNSVAISASLSPGTDAIYGQIANFSLLFTQSNQGVDVPGVPQVLNGVHLGAETRSMTTGADGNVYDALNNGDIYQVLTATHATGTLYETSALGDATMVTLGADHDIWYVDGTGGANQIGKFNPVTATATGPFVKTGALMDGANPITVGGITSAPDGNMYFTEDSGAGAVYQLVPGTMEYTQKLNPGDSNMTLIAGGNFLNGGQPSVCWVDANSPDSVVCGDLTTQAIYSSYNLASGSVAALAFGPDGNLYVAQNNPAQIVAANISSGVLTPIYTYPLAQSGSTVTGMTVGKDGNIWFTENSPGSGASFGSVTPGNGVKGVLNEYGAGTGLTAGDQTFGMTLDGNNDLAFGDITTGDVYELVP